MDVVYALKRQGRTLYGGHSLPLGMLGVSHGVTDHILEEDFEDAASFLVDEARDPFDAAPASQTANCRLRNSLNIITQDFPMPFCSSFSQALTSFATTRHILKDSLKEGYQAFYT